MNAQAVRLSNLDINKALKANEFELMFQPIFCLESGALSRVEAFVRWRHAKLGLLPPGAFISFFEAQGRMSELTRYVLNRALEDYCDWRGVGAPGFSINLALSDLADDAFISHFHLLMRDHDMDPGLITLECPMPPVDQDIRQAAENVARLKNTGARLAIEVRGRANDFLRKIDPFPFDEIKTGGAAILRFARTVRGPGLSAISELLELAQSTGSAISAVGVEDQASLSALRSLGFTGAQGNHLAKVGALSDITSAQLNLVRMQLNADQTQNPPSRATTASDNGANQDALVTRLQERIADDDATPNHDTPKEASARKKAALARFKAQKAAVADRTPAKELQDRLSQEFADAQSSEPQAESTTQATDHNPQTPEAEASPTNAAARDETAAKSTDSSAKDGASQTGVTEKTASENAAERTAETDTDTIEQTAAGAGFDAREALSAAPVAPDGRDKAITSPQPTGDPSNTQDAAEIEGDADDHTPQAPSAPVPDAPDAIEPSADSQHTDVAAVTTDDKASERPAATAPIFVDSGSVDDEIALTGDQTVIGNGDGTGGKDVKISALDVSGFVLPVYAVRVGEFDEATALYPMTGVALEDNPAPAADIMIEDPAHMPQPLPMDAAPADELAPSEDATGQDIGANITDGNDIGSDNVITAETDAAPAAVTSAYVQTPSDEAAPNTTPEESKLDAVASAVEQSAPSSDFAQAFDEVAEANAQISSPIETPSDEGAAPEEASPASISAPKRVRASRGNLLTRKYHWPVSLWRAVFWPDHFWPKSWKRSWARRAAYKKSLRPLED